MVHYVEKTSLQQLVLERLERVSRSLDLDPEYASALRLMLISLWEYDPQNPGRPAPISLLELPRLCAEAVGGARLPAEEVCAAWGIFYAAAHLLDDLEDGDTHAGWYQKFGPAHSLNLASGLIFVAETILCELEETSDLPHATCQMLRLAFNRCAVSTNAGQARDLAAATPDLERSWQIAAAKSGLFFSLGCRAGAATITSEPAYLEAFGAYGFHLGLLVQIANDIGGLWPGPEGRSDLTAGKISLPVAYTCSVLPAEAAAEFEALRQQAKTDPLAEVRARKMIREAGALVYLMVKAEKNRLAAQNAIHGLYLHRTAKEQLLKIPEYLLTPAKDGTSASP